MYAIIIADDIGDKLWPVTCAEFPKAFLPVYSDNTMLEETLMRVMPFMESGNDVYISLPEKSVPALLNQASLTAFSIPEKNLITIPDNKGSAWSILSLCQRITKKNKDKLLMIAPVDQFFWPRESILVHINNMLAGARACHNNLTMLCLPPGGPSPLLNYVSGEWQGVQTVGIPLEDALSGLLNTLMVDLQEFVHKPDFEQAQTMVTGNWLWDLSTYAAPVWNIEDQIRVCIPEDVIIPPRKNVLKIWDQLPYMSFEDTVVPSYIEEDRAKGAIIPKILWSTLDNWVSMQHLLFDAGLFNSGPTAGVHQVEAKNNLVFKPPGKEVALFGVSNLIIIDTGDKLLIGTPGGLYENF
jgi:mannose-1-phosphate guanylyltransferase